MAFQQWRHNQTTKVLCNTWQMILECSKNTNSNSQAKHSVSYLFIISLFPPRSLVGTIMVLILQETCGPSLFVLVVSWSWVVGFSRTEAV